MVKDNAHLRSPSQARAEIKQIAEELKEYRKFKQEHQFLGRRDRLLREGWRHGIVGVDDADSLITEEFYKDKRNAKLAAQAEKDSINDKRTRSKSH